MLHYGSTTTTHLTAHAQTRTHNNTTHHTPPTLAAPSQESKGLEFDDVCIFDFFADSPRECTWAVLSTLDGDEAAAGAATADRGAAPFDAAKDVRTVRWRAATATWEKAPAGGAAGRELWLHRGQVGAAR